MICTISCTWDSPWTIFCTHHTASQEFPIRLFFNLPPFLARQHNESMFSAMISFCSLAILNYSFTISSSSTDELQNIKFRLLIFNKVYFSLFNDHVMTNDSILFKWQVIMNDKWIFSSSSQTFRSCRSSHFYFPHNWLCTIRDGEWKDLHTAHPEKSHALVFYFPREFDQYLYPARSNFQIIFSNQAMWERPREPMCRIESKFLNVILFSPNQIVFYSLYSRDSECQKIIHIQHHQSHPIACLFFSFPEIYSIKHARTHGEPM